MLGIKVIVVPRTGNQAIGTNIHTREFDFNSNSNSNPIFVIFDISANHYSATNLLNGPFRLERMNYFIDEDLCSGCGNVQHDICPYFGHWSYNEKRNVPFMKSEKGKDYEKDTGHKSLSQFKNGPERNSGFDLHRAQEAIKDCRSKAIDVTKNMIVCLEYRKLTDEHRKLTAVASNLLNENSGRRSSSSSGSRSRNTGRQVLSNTENSFEIPQEELMSKISDRSNEETAKKRPRVSSPMRTSNPMMRTSNPMDITPSNGDIWKRFENWVNVEATLRLILRNMLHGITDSETETEFITVHFSDVREVIAILRRAAPSNNR